MRLVVLNNTRGSISGGYQKYLENIIPIFSEHKDVSEMQVFVPEDIYDSYRNFDYYIPFNNRRELINKVIYFAPDIIFCPSLQYTYKWQIPFVVMIRNMEPLAYNNKNNPLSEKIKNYLRKVLTKTACLNSNGIIAVSDYVKEYIIDNFHIDDSKIKNIYHGIEKNNISSYKKFSENQIFTAGSIRPARGLEDIISAFSLLKNKYPLLKLVIAGKVEPTMLNYKKKLNKLISSCGLTKRIIWLNEVKRQKMLECFSLSKVFVMTSRAEACPNIALEAMQNANFIISTSTKPMPEFFRDGAIYYTERNHIDLANKLEHMLSLTNNDLKKYKSKNIQTLNKFNWDTCANQTISFLNKVIKSSD